jgi:hypothetical protein
MLCSSSVSESSRGLLLKAVERVNNSGLKFELFLFLLLFIIPS